VECVWSINLFRHVLEQLISILCRTFYHHSTPINNHLSKEFFYSLNFCDQLSTIKKPQLMMRIYLKIENHLPDLNVVLWDVLNMGRNAVAHLFDLARDEVSSQGVYKWVFGKTNKTLCAKNLLSLVRGDSFINIELLFSHFLVANSLIHHAEVFAPGNLNHDFKWLDLVENVNNCWFLVGKRTSAANSLYRRFNVCWWGYLWG